jgi:hypothetical protein
MEMKKTLVNTSRKGQDAFQCAQAVLGLGHEQPGQERAQGQGEAGARGEQGDGEAQPQGGHQEELAAARAHDHEQDPGDDLLGQHIEKNDDPAGP